MNLQFWQVTSPAPPPFAKIITNRVRRVVCGRSSGVWRVRGLLLLVDSWDRRRRPRRGRGRRLSNRITLVISASSGRMAVLVAAADAAPLAVGPRCLVLGGHGRTAATAALHAAERRCPRSAAASVTILKTRKKNI